MLASIVAALALAGSALAAPTAEHNLLRRATIDDVTVLQYALTLEHIEATHYAQGLAAFDEAAFEKAGFPSWVRGRFAQIAAHEASHVTVLSSVIGANATKACTYKFPWTDPKSFVALSMAVEDLGTSAYTGAAQYISSKTYLTAAASILATEAKHDAWVSAPVLKQSAWDTAYQTPLGLDGVYSLASQFIVSCPASNPKLPVTTYPMLTVSGMMTVGSQLSVSYKGAAASGTYLAYYSGLNTFYSPISNGKTTVPSNLTNVGQAYAAVVSGNSASATTLTGLAILEYNFPSQSMQM